MPRIFRIHGDNIVECERIAKLILEETEPTSVEISLMSPSTIVYNIYFNYLGYHFAVSLTKHLMRLLPMLKMVWRPFFMQSSSIALCRPVIRRGSEVVVRSLLVAQDVHISIS